MWSGRNSRGIPREGDENACSAVSTGHSFGNLDGIKHKPSIIMILLKGQGMGTYMGGNPGRGYDLFLEVTPALIRREGS